MSRFAPVHDAPSQGSTLLQHAPAPGKAAPRHPSQIGRYVPVRVLGQGGMGVVYLAQDPSLRRWVALKLIRGATTAEELARFQREAELAARLQHPAIVRVLDFGQHEGAPYLVMEPIPGEPLRERVQRDGPLGCADAARLVASLAEALQHAHEAGVLHRDLKPGNVLLDSHGVPRLVDFGLARPLNEPDEGLTATGQILGTPAYMAPEQAQGDRAALGPACDVYGLGAVLYHLLTGRPPFQGESTLQVLEQVLAADPERPVAVRPGVDPALEAVCLRCLEKEPAARYPSAGALGDDLRRWLRGEPVQAYRERHLRAVARWGRRGGARTAGLLVAGACLGAVVTSASVGQAQRARAGVLEAAGAAQVASLSAAETALGLGQIPSDLEAVALVRLPDAGRRAAAERLARQARSLLRLDPGQACRRAEVARALAPSSPEALYALGRAQQARREESDPTRPVTLEELQGWYHDAIVAGSLPARAWELRWRLAGAMGEARRELAREAQELAGGPDPAEVLLLLAELQRPEAARRCLERALLDAGDPVLALHARAGLLRLGASPSANDLQAGSPLIDLYVGRSEALGARDQASFERGRERLEHAARNLAALSEGDKAILLQTLATLGDFGGVYRLATGDRDGSRLERFLEGLGGGPR